MQMPQDADFEADKVQPQPQAQAQAQARAQARAQAQHDPQSTSHLFLVRLWAESDSEGEAVWCGKVQHVTKGRPNQFRDWPALIDLFKAMLPDPERVRRHTALEE